MTHTITGFAQGMQKSIFALLLHIFFLYSILVAMDLVRNSSYSHPQRRHSITLCESRIPTSYPTIYSTLPNKKHQTTYSVLRVDPTMTRNTPPQSYDLNQDHYQNNNHNNVSNEHPMKMVLSRSVQSSDNIKLLLPLFTVKCYILLLADSV